MNQQKIRELAGRSGGHFYFESLASRPAQKREGVSFTFEQLEAFAKLVAAKEREACAKVAAEWVRAYPHPSEIIANNILARGEA